MRRYPLTLSHSEQSARRRDTRDVVLGLIIVGFCLLNTANAQTQIHKCTDAEGGVVYSQLPCRPHETIESEKTEPDAKAESAIQVSGKPERSTDKVPTEERELGADRAACKKRYRDAIDVIDEEIRREYSADKAEEYKQRLLQLTRKLREC